MIVLCRKFVVWLRTLLLTIVQKKPINWATTLGDLFRILADATTVIPEPAKPTTPDYDMIPKRPVRDFFRRLFR
jgi:hypothetical protein